MEQLILTTFIIIVIFSFLNFITTFFLFRVTSESIYKTTAIFWGTLIINFILQSFGKNEESLIIYLYGFAIVPLSLLSSISLSLAGLSFPRKKFLYLYAFSIILTLMLINTSYSFLLKAMPFSIATAAPLLYAGGKILLTNLSDRLNLMHGLAITLFLQGVHCINFALFRVEPGAQLWGWPVAYALYQLIAMILPAIILSYFHQRENDRLREQVRLRTGELEAAVDQKNKILKILSHDIVTPLSILQLRVDLYNRGRKPADYLAEGSQIVIQKIKDIIKYTKEEDERNKTKGDLDFEKFKIVDSIEKTLYFIEDKASLKNIKFIHNVHIDKDTLILGDTQAFQNSILSNILSNAIKFSHDNGEILIDVNSIGDKIEVKVSDNGVGIPNNLKDNLYSFSSLNSREGTDNEKGTGYGLGIVKKYMDLHDARIQVESQRQSESQSGFTTFILTFNKAC